MCLAAPGALWIKRNKPLFICRKTVALDKPVREQNLEIESARLFGHFLGGRPRFGFCASDILASPFVSG
jgi:hypothetical protein